MKILPKIKTIFNARSYSAKDAYKIWSENYDNEQDNLMLFYDKIIIRKFLDKINLKEKTILDYGCGTGRNWPEIFKYKPNKVIGCDISGEMLAKLKMKFPDAETHLLQNEGLLSLADKSCGIIISTLVIAYIKNLNKLFREWNRIIGDKAEIIITDLHPELLAKGGSRSFIYNGGLITIKSFIHNIKQIEKLMRPFGFKVSDLIEKKIDEDVKHFYEKRNALNVYEKFKGLPFIYGLLLRR